MGLYLLELLTILLFLPRRFDLASDYLIRRNANDDRVDEQLREGIYASQQSLLVILLLDEERRVLPYAQQDPVHLLFQRKMAPAQPDQNPSTPHMLEVMVILDAELSHVVGQGTCEQLHRESQQLDVGDHDIIKSVRRT